MKSMFLVSENGLAKPTYTIDRWQALSDAGERGETDIGTLMLLYRLFCDAYRTSDNDDDFKAAAVAQMICVVLMDRGVSVDTLCEIDPLPYLTVEGRIVGEWPAASPPE